MKNSKKFNMPVQGKSVPRYGSSSNYEANVNPSIFGAVLPVLGGIAKTLLG